MLKFKYVIVHMGKQIQHNHHYVLNAVFAAVIEFFVISPTAYFPYADGVLCQWK